MNAKLVIFFHPYFSDGGVERTNILLAKSLIASGYDVIFLTTEVTGHYKQEVKDLGIKVMLLGSGHVSLKIFKIFKTLTRLQRKYPKIYFVSCQYYVNVVSMLIAVLFKPFIRSVKFINSERNHISEFTFRRGIKNWLIPKLVKLSYGFADVVIANSEETADDLSTFIKRQVICVYNPTINTRLKQLKVEGIDESWFIHDNRPAIMAVGRLSAQKDFLTLLRAYDMARTSINAKLVILGEGEKRQELEDFIRSNGLENDVFLPGFIKNPYKFMSKAALFVLSSRYEGLPNALIEATYLGLPCVSTSCKSGPMEILSNGDAGYLVPVGDSTLMKDAIVEVFNNKDEALKKQKIAEAGLHRFKPESVSAAFEIAINS